MNRRALLTRGGATLLASVLPFTLLSQDTKAATAPTKAQIAKSKEVERLIAGFWDLNAKLRGERVSNDVMKAALEGYLAEKGLKLPVRLSKYVTINGKTELVAMTWHRMERETNGDGAQVLYLPATAEQLGPLMPTVLNIQMPRA